jgi:hypothetical protein
MSGPTPSRGRLRRLRAMRMTVSPAREASLRTLAARGRPGRRCDLGRGSLSLFAKRLRLLTDSLPWRWERSHALRQCGGRPPVRYRFPPEQACNVTQAPRTGGLAYRSRIARAQSRPKTSTSRMLPGRSPLADVDRRMPPSPKSTPAEADPTCGRTASHPSSSPREAAPPTTRAAPHAKPHHPPPEPLPTRSRIIRAASSPAAARSATRAGLGVRWRRRRSVGCTA